MANSPLNAEAIAFLDAAQAIGYLAHMVVELLSTLRPFIKCFVDKRWLVDAMYSLKSVEVKHFCVEVAVHRGTTRKRLPSLNVGTHTNLVYALRKKITSICKSLACIKTDP